MKKITPYLLLSFLFFYIPEIKAQVSVNSSGGIAIGNSGSSSYSIGQITYTYLNSTGGMINQGIQLPYEIVSLDTEDFPDITMQVVVYPNPTDSFVFLKIENMETQKLNYILSDINGKELFKHKIELPQTQIDMNNLSTAVYFLKVIDNGKILKTFRIIKNN